MSFDDTFTALRALFKPHENALILKHDTDTNYYLEETKTAKKPQMFGAVQIKKNYVSVHLMPVYCEPSLLESTSDTLRKRMQGKSCFNFKTRDEIPEKELSTLIEKSVKWLKGP
ncbi:MAG: hypothetical protein AAFO78_04445 [Pseudomonadota bacterium]